MGEWGCFQAFDPTHKLRDSSVGRAEDRINLRVGGSSPSPAAYKTLIKES